MVHRGIGGRRKSITKQNLQHAPNSSLESMARFEGLLATVKNASAHNRQKVKNEYKYRIQTESYSIS